MYKVGDILLVKEKGALPWLISRSLGLSSLGWDDGFCSNHNAIIGVDDNMRLSVYEMTRKGIKRLKLKDYLDNAESGHCELIIARYSRGLNHREKMHISKFLETSYRNKIKYDYKSYVSHFWREFLGMWGLVPIQDKDKMWCTEMVRDAYREANIYDVLMPCIINPRHVEEDNKIKKLITIKRYLKCLN